MKCYLITFNTQAIIGSSKSCQNQFTVFTFVSLFTYIKSALEDKIFDLLMSCLLILIEYSYEKFGKFLVINRYLMFVNHYQMC